MREIKFRAWDGSRDLGYKVHGYQMRKVSYHPNANSRGYVQEHRLIIENQLGRYLIPRKELVHHVNGVRDDNNIKNLELSNPKDHAKGHVGERNPNGRFATEGREFQQKKFRLYDKDRDLTKVFTLSELIGKTFRRGSFEYRGEFTGLKDKNGVEVYEGDILSEPISPVGGKNGKYLYANRVIKWLGSGSGYGLYAPGAASEVIGNIHQNPELLKGDT